MKQMFYFIFEVIDYIVKKCVFIIDPQNYLSPKNYHPIKI